MPRLDSFRRLRGILGRPLDDRWFNTAFLLFLLFQFFSLPALRHYGGAILLHQLPFPDSDRVYTLAERRWSGTTIGVTDSALRRWRERGTTLESIATYSYRDLDNAGESLTGARVSEEFFPLLGSHVIAGRPLAHADFRKGAPRVILLSYQYWQTRFGQNASVIGRGIWLGSLDYQIVGVLPPNFWFLSRKPSVWLPTSLEQQARESGPRDLNAIGRAKRRISAAAIETQLGELEREENPNVPERYRRQIGVVPIHRVLLGDLSIAFWMLLIPFASLLISSSLLVSRQVSMRRDWITLAPYMLFMAAKMALLGFTLICLWVVLQDATTTLGTNFPLALTLQVTQDVVYFLFCMKVAHWCALDQKYRCRICLARMRMPLMSGTPNSILMDRSGDEYICPEGHGQLYVPSETPADEGEAEWKPSKGIWEELLFIRKQ